MLDAFNQQMQEWYRNSGGEKRLVFGEGKPKARIMLIGEAPGAQEEEQGRPFVGRAGKNLDHFLQKTGMVREDLYISNTVKFRTTKISAAGRVVNRTPSEAEIEAFLPWLKKEIDLVRPGCVVTLGNTPLKALMGKQMTIGTVHATVLKCGEYPLFPLYHPASVIYSPALATVYEEDLQRLKLLNF